MSTQRKQTEAEMIAAIRAQQAGYIAAATKPPAGYEATCPDCGGDSNATLIRKWGHCMACHNGRVVALANSYKG